MDSKTIFSKTAKGMKEASGATATLPRGIRGILKEVDGKRTYADLQKAVTKYSESELVEALEYLLSEGYMRDIAQRPPAATPIVQPPPAPTQPADGFDDLDFTAIGKQAAAPQPPSPPAATAADVLQRKLMLEKQLAEIKARKDEEARTAADLKAKQDALEKARLAAQAKAKQDAEEKARRDGEAKARAQAEARAAAELKAKQDALEKARREAEEKARRDAEAKARAQTEARIAAELKAKQEALEKARKEAEERAQIEAKMQARREAEERIRREVEEQTRREAEERALREAEEQARREAEELARREAEERARREAEEQARREVEELARREAEERARREAEEEAQRKAAEDEKRAAKILAKENARAAAATAKAEKAASKAARATMARQIRWGKLIALATPVLLGVAIGAIHLIPFSGRIPGLEKIASEQFHQPVKIASLHLALFPEPRWRLEGIVIGSASEITAPHMEAVIDLGSVGSDNRSYKTFQIESPVIRESAAGWLIFGKPQGEEIKVGQIIATDILLEASGVQLPRFDARAEMDAHGNWQKLHLDFSNREVRLQLAPGNNGVQMEMRASSFVPPIGMTTAFSDFSAKGTLGQRELVLQEFEGRSFGGTFSGRAVLRWGEVWSLDASLNAAQLDAGQIAPALLARGRVDATAQVISKAKNAAGMASTTRIDGSFKIGTGEVVGVDLMHLLANSGDTGKTGFRELSGSFSADGQIVQLRQIRLDAGVLSATGSTEVGPNETLRGHFTAAYRFDNQAKSSALTLSGTLHAPKTSR